MAIPIFNFRCPLVENAVDGRFSAAGRNFRRTPPIAAFTGLASWPCIFCLAFRRRWRKPLVLVVESVAERYRLRPRGPFGSIAGACAGVRSGRFGWPGTDHAARHPRHRSFATQVLSNAVMQNSTHRVEFLTFQ